MNVRLRDWLEKNNGWRESQAGFRRNRSTRDHIFTLNSIIGNKLRKKKGRLYIAYIDFKTAFDVIDRRILLEKLEKKRVNGRMLKMIGSIYELTRNEFITKEGTTESFVTRKGVRQGCPLSRTLFSVFIEDLDDRWERYKEGGTVIGRKKIYGLKFADDVAMVADTVEGLQWMLNDLERYAEENRMEVNVKKTKIMVCRNGGALMQGERWNYKGEELESVNEYK